MRRCGARCGSAQYDYPTSQCHTPVHRLLSVATSGASGSKNICFILPIILINAVTHRDYFYDSSHIYIHMYPDRMEIENPGGLPRGITIEKLGSRSVRRNRLIADLLQHRAKYINRVGSGFDRMQQSLAENSNPPLEVSTTNFFNLRFYRRVKPAAEVNLTARQWQLYRAVINEGSLAKSAASLLATPVFVFQSPLKIHPFFLCRPGETCGAK